MVFMLLFMTWLRVLAIRVHAVCAHSMLAHIYFLALGTGTYGTNYALSLNMNLRDKKWHVCFI